MKKFLFLFLLSAFYFLLSTSARAQTDVDRVADLKRQIEELEKQAETYRNSIAQQQAEATSLKQEIGAIEAQIKNIQLQVKLTGIKIDKTKLEVGNVEKDIYDAQQKITAQQKGISQLIAFLNRQDNESLLSIVLKNENLSDFFKQAENSKDISKKLTELINDLKTQKQTLENQKNELEDKQQELENLNQQRSSQKSALGGTKTSKNQLLAQTKGQEAQYQKLLRDVEERKTKFFIELQKYESDIVAGGVYIVHVTAGKLPPRGTNLFRWPEEGYRITQGYGMTRYARRGAYGGAPHNGIDMASGYGSLIWAIGDGEIIANGANSGWGNWIAVKHPPINLVSVYGHMSALSPLKVGTQVKAGDIIGYEGATGNATGSHLHLSLYKDFFTYMKGTELYFNYFDGSVNPDDYM